MREYGKVFSRIWESADFRALSEDGRSLVLYLLTCQHGTIAGVFRVPDGYACEDLQWSSARVAKGFAELFDKGFATRCEATKWVWVAKYLEWNPPENPNQRKAAAKVVASVPPACCWKRAFLKACGRSLGIESEPDPEQLPNRSETVPESFRESGTGTGVGEVSEEANASSSSPGGDLAGGQTQGDKAPPCPYDAIVIAYHEALPSLPRVKLMDEKRQKAMRTFWAWVFTSRRSDGERRASTAQAALAWAEAYFERAGRNDFLMGRAPSRGHENWRADFDFLLTDRGRKHVLEKTDQYLEAQQ
ncbi:MAG: hypothetical protein RIS88_2771 [Pseudomonadota bacterium]|jgi:hypothetical protein